MAFSSAYKKLAAQYLNDPKSSQDVLHMKVISYRHRLCNHQLLVSDKGYGSMWDYLTYRQEFRLEKGKNTNASQS